MIGSHFALPKLLRALNTLCLLIPVITSPQATSGIQTHDLSPTSADIFHVNVSTVRRHLSEEILGYPRPRNS